MQSQPETKTQKLNFLQDFAEKNKCFEDEKVISMFMAMYESIENTKNNMFRLNSYSNTATIKNTEMMVKNYVVFMFLLENLHSLNKQRLEMFLSIFKWDDDCLVLDFYDFSLVKMRYFDCLNHDFTEEQLTIFK